MADKWCYFPLTLRAGLDWGIIFLSSGHPARNKGLPSCRAEEAVADITGGPGTHRGRQQLGVVSGRDTLRDFWILIKHYELKYRLTLLLNLFAS